MGLSVDDRRLAGEQLELSFHGELTPIQQQAARALLEHDIGVLVAPCGVGKTVIGAYLVAERACSTLVLVHREFLLQHWLQQLCVFLDLKQSQIGQIGAGKRKPNGRLDVAMFQSLDRKGEVNDRVADYGQVIVDECHRVPAFSFERVISEARARYLTGLTATPQRSDGHQPILHMQLGPIRFSVNSRSRAARRPFDCRVVVRSTAFEQDEGDEADRTIHQLYRALASDEDRNRLILDDVMSALEEGRSPLLLTERREHLDKLAELLAGLARHLVVLVGGRTARQRREVAARLAAIPKNEERLVLATGRYIGEGFDDTRLDTLFLALPVSWKGTLIQYAGRLHRSHPGKSEVRIFDYVDGRVPRLARMFKRRLKGYRAMHYAIDGLPEGMDDTAHTRGKRADSTTLPLFGKR